MPLDSMASRGRVGKQLLVVLSVGLSAGRRPAAIVMMKCDDFSGPSPLGSDPGAREWKTNRILWSLRDTDDFPG